MSYAMEKSLTHELEVFSNAINAIHVFLFIEFTREVLCLLCQLVCGDSFHTIQMEAILLDTPGSLKRKKTV